MHLEFFDLSGALIYSRAVDAQAPGPLNETVDVSHWASGVYFVALRSVGTAHDSVLGIFKFAIVH